ncbi:MAG: aldo/keto reductase [Bacillota bacterium]|jgi:aryl-alcohol dehydrogenase-like predicted oxidoreductase|nr:aldo/keto reductase [Bacillota bacterium]
MIYRNLGGTGIRVSRFCLGTLTMGPLQARLDVKKGAGLIRLALDRGVNFLDTAEDYRTYPYIRAAVPRHATGVVIASRCYAYTAKAMQASLERALRETGRETIDLFGLHEQESSETLKGHWDAMEYLRKARDEGKVRAVYVSTHFVRVVRAILALPEIDAVFPLLNMSGTGIRDGSRDDMVSAIRQAHLAGKGVWAMKPLAGGHLSGQSHAALAFVRDIPEVDSVAVGASSAAEIEFDAMVLSGETPPKALEEEITSSGRHVVIEPWCQGCGKCVSACRSGALSVAGGRASVDPSRCILCSYCAAACDEFCIKVMARKQGVTG